MFSMLCYQSPYSMTVLQLILETNGREATEFLAGHGVANQLLMSSVITLCVLLASMLAVEFFKNKIRTWMSTVMTTLLFLSACTQGYSYFRLWQAYTANVTTTIAENKYMPLRNSPFVRFLYGHALNVVSTRELETNGLAYLLVKVSITAVHLQESKQQATVFATLLKKCLLQMV